MSESREEVAKDLVEAHGWVQAELCRLMVRIGRYEMDEVEGDLFSLGRAVENLDAIARSFCGTVTTRSG